MAAKANGQVTRSKPSDMKEVVQKVFERFDANKDGQISSEELANVMISIGSKATEEEISSMMNELDTDKDGYINLQEFASFCNGGDAAFYGGEGGGGGGVKEIHEAFEFYDQDHDGFISASELHQILTRLGERCSIHDCVNMIKSVDSDGDGKVNFEEFTNMMYPSTKKDS